MKLLLVDDHPLFRDGIALLLRELAPEIRVRHAGNLDAALSALAAEPGIELILLDFILPGTQGLQAIEMLRDRHPEIPVVILSSQADPLTVLRSIDLGAMGFIPKSSSTVAMFEALRTVLAGSVYIPPLDVPGVPNRAAAKPFITPDELGLTPRQTEVLRLILEGKPMKLIASELALTHNTVKTHVSAVLKALAVTTRTQAVVTAHRMGLVLGPPRR